MGLRGKVATVGRLVYCQDESARVHFEANARMRWIEFRPVPEETTSAYLRRVAAAGLRLMVDADRVRRLLGMLERYHQLLVEKRVDVLI